MILDVSQTLKDAENSLRDFIANQLTPLFGSNWIEQCGFKPEKIDKWKERKSEEEKRQETGVVEERLIYYADFYDLQTILTRHWEKVFKEVFKDKRELEVWLTTLEGLRNPEAHRRELLPHQKHLAIGVSGEIRARIVRYRSKMETSEDYFPRIESVRDSLGNMVLHGGDRWMICRATLRVGDQIDFVITASDPQGGELEYSVAHFQNEDPVWQADNNFTISLTDDMVGTGSTFNIFIRSLRKYHAHGQFDDHKRFTYCVLPPK